MPKQIELLDIESPCCGICQSNKKGYCFGCLRSRTERQLWLKMTNEQKRDVLQLIAVRQKRVERLRKKKTEQMKLQLEKSHQNEVLF